eukprot:35456-Eustigmatos_ZCMA.PRE.1
MPSARLPGSYVLSARCLDSMGSRPLRTTTCTSASRRARWPRRMCSMWTGGSRSTPRTNYRQD